MASWFDTNTIGAIHAGPVSSQPGPSTQGPTADQPPTGGMVGAPGTFVNQSSATPVPPGWQPGQTIGVSPTTSGDPISQFQTYLAKHQDDPQAAIDEWNAAGDPGGLKPMWQPSTKTIGIQGNKYLVMPGTGANPAGGSWQVIERPGQEGGSSGSVTPTAGAPGIGTFSYAPFTDQFTNPGFEAPTGLTEANDPGYQSRLALGAKALQQSAAAKGTLLSGQTLSDLNDYAQNQASNEYGQVYNRALQSYGANSQNNWNQYNQKYQQYLSGFNQALQGYGANLGANQQAFGQGETQWQNVFNQSAQNFGQNQQNWQNQFNVAGMGLGASEFAAGLGQNYGNQAGNLYQGMGNSQAAGTIGQGNAYNYALGNIANLGTGYLYNSIYGQQNPHALPPVSNGGVM